jgi:hypothetical protein
MAVVFACQGSFADWDIEQRQALPKSKAAIKGYILIG